MNPFSRAGPATFFPSIWTSPDVGRSSPAMILRRVLLPQPEGPTMLMNSPLPIPKLTSCKTSRKDVGGLLREGRNPDFCWACLRNRFETFFISHFIGKALLAWRPELFRLDCYYSRHDFLCEQINCLFGIRPQKIKRNRDIYPQPRKLLQFN